MNKYVMILTTAGSEEEARKIAERLLADKLVACVQVTEIRSYYTWKGSLADEREQLLLIKTREALAQRVEEAILSVHSYETPEVIIVAVGGGSKAYLDWVDAETAAGDG